LEVGLAVNKTLHIIFLRGVSQAQAAEITEHFARHRAPFGHEVSVVGFPDGDPALLGVVVVNDESETAMDFDPVPFQGSNMIEAVATIEVG